MFLAIRSFQDTRSFEDTIVNDYHYDNAPYASSQDYIHSVSYPPTDGYTNRISSPYEEITKRSPKTIQKPQKLEIKAIEGERDKIR